MSTSLRDQLLKAGLINKKQADDTERQLERQERERARPAKHGGRRPGPGAPSRDTAAPGNSRPGPPAIGGAVAVRPPVDAAKAARDKELNRRKQEKAELKAKRAQIKQLIEQSRLPSEEAGEPYSFIDGAKVRRIHISGDARVKLGRGELAIVRHDGGYDVVPASIAARVRERDPAVVVPLQIPAAATEPEPGYEAFPVPDDLMW